MRFRYFLSGNVVVEGRIKDTINRGGEKISAEEVENHILAHPDVDNCAYVAMPDPYWVRRPAPLWFFFQGKRCSLNH